MAMADNRRIREISLIVQEKTLLKAFPESIVKRNSNRSLIWVGQLRPTPLSREYTLKIKLEGGRVEIYVMEPQKLDLFPGKTLLPHVYSTPKQRLCLYFPDGREWNKGKLLCDTIVPWASEWLYFYEIWLVAGNWLGGGTEHDFEKKNNAA